MHSLRPKAPPTWLDMAGPTQNTQQAVIVIAVLLFLAIPSGSAHITPDANELVHPDMLGLLGLKASICGDNCTELSSWTPTGDVCSSFDGVYCGWVLGAWRVVGVQLQLDAESVLFNDSAMHLPGGGLGKLEYLRELEVLCVKHRHPPSPSPGPPAPPPTPSNTPQQQRQRKHQQQLQQQQDSISRLRQELQFGAAAEQQGLAVSRWLAATETASADHQRAGPLPALHQAQHSGAQQQLQPEAERLRSINTASIGSQRAGPFLHTLPQHQGAQQQLGQLQPPSDQAIPAMLPAANGLAADLTAEQADELPYSWFKAYPLLTHLRVVGCGAAGTLQGAAVAHARHLASLVLNNNRLTGTLPDEFVGLKGLLVLDLSGNQLSGSLPLSWVGLHHLHYLYLNNNNLTGVLPCEYAQLQLLLADLSGNHWHAQPIGGDLGCELHGALKPTIIGSVQQNSWSGGQVTAAAAATAAGGAEGSRKLRYSLLQPGLQIQRLPSQQQGQDGGTSTSSSSSGVDAVLQQQQLASIADAAVGSSSPTAPRCWLRRYCYDEGAFICLERKAKAVAAGGCSSYVYGASDLHIDAQNQCDHGGPHLVAITAMFAVFGAVLVLIWLHHCRVMRWMSQPSSTGGSQQQQRQQQGPWQQRQWLISGPTTPTHRARARSLGGGTGAAAVHTSSSNSSLKEPLLPQPPVTLPLLYHPANAEHEGAGYSSPVSSSSAVDFIENVTVGTPEGVLPSALTTPSAGAISIRPQGPAGGPYGRGGRGADQQGGLGGAGRRGAGMGMSGRQGAAAAGRGRSGEQRQHTGAYSGADGEQVSSSGYDSDSSSNAGVPVSSRDRTTATLSAHWLKPEYYFQGNEPLPPWAGGVARMLAATLAPAHSGSTDGSRGSDGGCFSSALMLPLTFLFLDSVTNLRLLLLWGVGPPAHVKLWPSYALLGLMCVPHLLVGAVVHFRLLAVSCLPPALKAAAIREDQLSEDILPPGAGAVVKLYSWLFAAPAWLAYPVMLLLLGPGVLLLTVLCPLVLLMACVGLGSFGGVVRYIQLLQGCAALTQSTGSAGLLTVLFLMGNLPLEWAFLDSSLYYLTAAADLANIAVAWWLRLQAVRRQQALALAALPATTGQQWT